MDSLGAVEDTRDAAEEIGARMDAAANATGGNVGSGGTVGGGGAGAGGAVGAGGTGAGAAVEAGAASTLDAAAPRDGAGGAAIDQQTSGKDVSHGGGAGGATTSTLIGTGGAAGGNIGSGGTDGLDGGLGTGGHTSLLDLVPRDNSIPGWTIDPSNPLTATRVAAIAKTQSEAEALIDGAAADFFAGPAIPTMFVWQNYVNANLPSPGSEPGGSALSLYLLELPSAEQAINLYSSLRQAPLYTRSTWVDPTSPAIGIRSRITDTGSTWWVNFCKGRYYVEVSLTPSYGPPPDYAGGDASQKQAALAFAAALAARM